MTRILVVHGSKRGGTAGLAAVIGAAMTGAGALYAKRWHRDARRFVRHNADAHREANVWLVSSGPLDDSAAHRDIPPTDQVRKLMTRVHARGHVTFGGRLSPDAKGFPASAMAKTKAGDWRDADHVQRWAASVVETLEPGSATTQSGVRRRNPAS